MNLQLFKFFMTPLVTPSRLFLLLLSFFIVSLTYSANNFFHSFSPSHVQLSSFMSLTYIVGFCWSLLVAGSLFLGANQDDLTLKELSRVYDRPYSIVIAKLLALAAMILIIATAGVCASVAVVATSQEGIQSFLPQLLTQTGNALIAWSLGSVLLSALGSFLKAETSILFTSALIGIGHLTNWYEGLSQKVGGKLGALLESLSGLWSFSALLPASSHSSFTPYNLSQVTTAMGFAVFFVGILLWSERRKIENGD